MKAILMKGDIFLGVFELGRLQSELIIPIYQALSLSMREETEPNKLPTTAKMVFQLETPGRNYAVYQLRGFDK